MPCYELLSKMCTTCIIVETAVYTEKKTDPLFDNEFCSGRGTFQIITFDIYLCPAQVMMSVISLRNLATVSSTGSMMPHNFL